MKFSTNTGKKTQVPQKFKTSTIYSKMMPFLSNLPSINYTNREASVTFDTNTQPVTLSGKKVFATQKFKMATMFKMATI